MRRTLALPPAWPASSTDRVCIPALTARRNLAALARLRGEAPTGSMTRSSASGSRDVAEDRVRGFSLGMRQRLGLAAALLTTPRLLVLDEPANGLDPAGTRHVHRVLTELAAGGTAIVLSSHRMDDLAALCNEITVLAAGRVVFSGPIAELADERGHAGLPAANLRSGAAHQIAGAMPRLCVLPPRRSATAA